MRAFLALLASFLFLTACTIISDRVAEYETRDHIKPIHIGVRKTIIKDKN